ncbi:hypothetical protein INT48_000816 [Thamnidium elegans]|uniref:Uncharacterized protein n=1 Tax=Thamnidium elegans TaxID=101142 RepID=A0A8H7SWW1_9FUNG|nr:hypothetical protein INT48_000816 [Thamnidium elegans]
MAIEINIWRYVSLVTSIVTFLITAFYIYKYRSIKAVVTAGSASISALAFLISNVLVLSPLNTPPIKTSPIFMLRGIRYAFAFHAVFYAFQYIIYNNNQNKKLVVYIGYIWMAVTISVSIATAVLFNVNTFSSVNIYDLLVLTKHSIWGFIAVALLLYFTNKKHLNRKSRATMSVFIGLNLISAITATVITYVPIYIQDLGYGVAFFLDELIFKVAIIIAACYGSTWIQTGSSESYGSKTESDSDLEINQESNTSH